MNVTNDMSIFTLITGASLPVQLVMLILLITSLISWWYIFIKVFSLKTATENIDQFEAQFWAGGDLNDLYERISAGHKTPQGMASIFQAGLKEFIRYKQQKDTEVSDVMEATRRAMRAAYNRELDYLDSHLPFLASVGSVSPYIGLFGTVWGIMNAFRGLSTVAQATLSQVAPGIAEALVATAIGLFAAIPAVIAYNRFAAGVDRLSVRYESFIEEFTNILQRRA
ncbi:protein TolQ [Methylophilus aquaticus]|uniref:Tol-Pal system protein TolQ n=1 Tax=Methylophilus aquaticus TaxID=1971610 RepID=A0ABT9JPP7_9PROT|nr:protein TolQ [Methylophilus aquaticus]MDP8566540.1 protein TolQ [Methylophilus aquaticus]